MTSTLVHGACPHLRSENLSEVVWGIGGNVDLQHATDLRDLLGDIIG